MFLGDFGRFNMFALTRSNFLNQFPDPNEIIGSYFSYAGKQFNRSIFMKTAITFSKVRGTCFG